MPIDVSEWIGYAIGVISVVLSVIFHRISQRRNRERLARLLDPHVIHQRLLRCRNAIHRENSTKVLHRLFARGTGVYELAVLHEVIRNVQKYVLVVRSEHYEQYDTLLAEAREYLQNGQSSEGLRVLNEALIRLEAEAKVLGE